MANERAKGRVRKTGLRDALAAASEANPGKRVELWFMDEARVGQKGRTGFCWWVRGERPRGLCDRRFEWAYLFGAVRPATGDDFALVLPESPPGWRWGWRRGWRGRGAGRPGAAGVGTLLTRPGPRPGKWDSNDAPCGADPGCSSGVGLY